MKIHFSERLLAVVFVNDFFVSGKLMLFVIQLYINFVMNILLKIFLCITSLRNNQYK